MSSSLREHDRCSYGTVLNAHIHSFKHRYLLFALDNGILLDLLAAIHAHQKVELELAADRRGGRKQAIVVPLKIYISTQGGRQYIAAYSVWKKKITFFRLDAIVKVKPLDVEPEYEALQGIYNTEQSHIWGVSCGQYRLEHLEMVLAVAPKDVHIIHRLEREKRYGEVAQTS
ncbi:MAG: WYL domain-containing protein, partial [Deltaproteobacteria bacterium]|nr:WYL domain-containing protein [Deltaproteobacteria bacterium]